MGSWCSRCTRLGRHYSLVSLVHTYRYIESWEYIPASVLGEGGVVIVDNSGAWVEDDVLEDRAELDGVEDIWLLLGGKANALGVATTLNVEDTLIRPAVLVITNQSPLRVCGESGLAGTR